MSEYGVVPAVAVGLGIVLVTGHCKTALTQRLKHVVLDFALQHLSLTRASLEIRSACIASLDFALWDIYNPI